MFNRPTKDELLQLIDNTQKLNSELLSQVGTMEKLIMNTEDNIVVNKICREASEIIDKYHHNEGYIRYLRSILEQLK